MNDRRDWCKKRKNFVRKISILIWLGNFFGNRFTEKYRKIKIMFMTHAMNDHNILCKPELLLRFRTRN